MTAQRLKIFGIAAAVSLAVWPLACSKSKFTTKPQLRFLSAESYNIPRGGIISFRIEFTDKEGDLTDSIFILSRTTRCTQSNRRLGYPIPRFNAAQNTKGEFFINFVNGQFLQGYVALPGPACGRPDTTTFFFWVKDKAQNVSDTVKTDKPLVILN